MDTYYYDGPVKSFENVLCSRWHGETRAVSPQKAMSNLVYQYKKSHNLLASSRITLPGTLKMA